MGASAERRRALRSWRRPGGARFAALRSGRRSRSVLPSSFRHRPRSPSSTQHRPTRDTSPDHQTMYLPGAVIQNRTRPGCAEQPTLGAAHDHRNPLPSYVAISSKAAAPPGRPVGPRRARHASPDPEPTSNAVCGCCVTDLKPSRSTSLAFSDRTFGRHRRRALAGKHAH